MSKFVNRNLFNSGTMAEKTFRVLLDVRDLQLQRLKFVWISVSPQDNRTIADLKSTIIRKIHISTTEIKLSVREGILLDEETTTVLREDDTVKVEYDGIFTFFQDDRSNQNTAEPEFIARRYDECTPRDKTSKSKKHKTKGICDDETGKGREFKDKNSDLYNSEDESSKAKKCKTVRTAIDDKDKISKRKKENKDLSHEQGFNIKSQTCDKIVDNEIPNSVEVDSNLSKESKKKKSECKESKKKKSEQFSESNGYCDSVVKVNNESLLTQTTSTENTLKDSFESEIVSENIINQSTSKTNNCPKKKRKRKRNRNRINSLSEVIVPLDSSAVDVSNVISSSPSHSKRKHIIYDSPNPYIESTTKESHECCTLNSDDTEINILNSSYSYAKDNSVFEKQHLSSAKVSTPAEKNDKLNLDCDASEIRNEQTTVGDLKEIPMEVTSLMKDSHLTLHDSAAKGVPANLNNATFLKYDNLPPLTRLPEVGSKIAYKILELDESYSPVVSEFREGIVTEVKSKTEEMVIELSKHIIKPGRVGKFEILKENEVPYPEIIKEEIVSWNCIIEPKLLV